MPLPSNKSIATQESHIWLQYHVIHEGQKVQLVKAAHAQTKEMMEMMHSSPEDYMKLYLYALSSKIETNVYEKETPSHRDIMSLTTHGDNSVCQFKTTPTK